ncbi:hypothetical protein AN958_07465 [Leucoagaricus sp. SymC.cos]|nr:hypothetical protein AN958_07465 [Leucoagaricus sp. SymC.cos]
MTDRAQDAPEFQAPTTAPSEAGSKVEEKAKNDDRTPEIEQDDALADRLSLIVEDANSRVVPMCDMIRKHIENMEAQKEEDRDEDELVKQVKPLLEQAEKVLHETSGSIHGADPDNRLTSRGKRNMQDHVATPSEQRLAEALKVLVGSVQGTVSWAKDKLEAFHRVKKDLGPLLDALGRKPLINPLGPGEILTGSQNQALTKLIEQLIVSRSSSRVVYE